MKAYIVVLFLIITQSSLVKADDSIIDILDVAMQNMKEEKWKDAKSKLREALSYLSYYQEHEDVISSTYWNLHIVEWKLGDQDGETEALIGFITYGFLSIENSKDFRDKKDIYELKRNLYNALSVVQARWAGRNKYFCRSKLFSCYVRSKVFIKIFEENVPFCSGTFSMYETVVDGDFFRTDVSCFDSNETYYFTTKQ